LLFSILKKMVKINVNMYICYSIAQHRVFRVILVIKIDKYIVFREQPLMTYGQNMEVINYRKSETSPSVPNFGWL
jgi:hypothetical protein